MKDNNLQSGLIGGLLGALIVWFLATSTVNSGNMPLMRMMGFRSTGAGEAIIYPDDMGMGMGSSMTDMMSSLNGKTGDEFDQNFLEAMIVHHEGAVAMARLAVSQAKHEELKKFARDIIKVQSKEIDQMKSWMTSWGY